MGKGAKPNGSGKARDTRPAVPEPLSTSAASASAAGGQAVGRLQAGVLDLRSPALAFGRQGVPLGLVANHFELALRGGAPAAAWVTWEVEFSVSEPQPETRKGGKARGKGGAASGSAGKEPSKALRRQAVAAALSSMPSRSWVYDGRKRLWTLKSSEHPDRQPPADWQRVAVPPQREVQVRFAPAGDGQRAGRQQEFSLAELLRPSAAGRAEHVLEARRFLHVAMLSFAAEQLQGLFCRGRLVVCPGLRPEGAASDMALRNARELWLGYLAQVEIIHGPRGPRCTLSLNLVASVGLRQMSAIELVARLWAEAPETKRTYPGNTERNASWLKTELEANRGAGELTERFLRSLDSEAGLRGLRASVDYFGRGPRTQLVTGITREPASRRLFRLEEEQRDISVAKYFAWKHPGVPLLCPDLPCLQLGTSGACIPIELVTILGGEHNVLVGRLRPEYQADVTKVTTMEPSKRKKAIQDVVKDLNIGPRQALGEKGVDVALQMLKVEGRVLDAPVLEHRGGTLQPNGYAARLRAMAPPEYAVAWGLWCFTNNNTWELESFADEVVNVGRQRGLDFAGPRFAEWPRSSWSAFADGRDRQGDSLEEALRDDLDHLHRGDSKIQLLVVLLPDKEDKTARLRGFLKLLTETEAVGPVTQCINCRPMQGTSGIEAAKKKLNNLMLKIIPKLPLRASGEGGTAHHVRLQSPCGLLVERPTMVMGADVTHRAAGVSVAGVVASTDRHFVAYFSEMRGQTPFNLEGDKQRLRKSEERIVDLDRMAESLLRRWQHARDRLPAVILYYRDGVSDGQFVDVLQRERFLLQEAFRKVGGPEYDPELVIIVGQKRHQTRFWKDGAEAAAETSGKGIGGQGQGAKAGGKGVKGDPSQVPPGTVAGAGIAQLGHLNFFLVSHVGIKGTSVPCHYHVLHLDERLAKRGVGIDALERTTYELCHLYSRADKTVGYASPAYLADHLCERGKLYLETKFPTALDIASWAPSGGSSDPEEARLREQIKERVCWLNDVQARRAAKGTDVLQGCNYFC